MKGVKDGMIGSRNFKKGKKDTVQERGKEQMYGNSAPLPKLRRVVAGFCKSNRHLHLNPKFSEMLSDTQ